MPPGSPDITLRSLPPTATRPPRQRQRYGCSPSTRSPSPRCLPGWHLRSTPWRTRHRYRVATGGPSLRGPPRCSTSGPSATPHRRSASLPHDHAHDRAVPPPRAGRPARIGVGGPVGSGKTALVAALCRALRDELRVGVVTNDIYTTEDAEALRRMGVLDDERIVAVETGCCPHTAIRDDISANLDAVEALEAAHAPLDLVL